MKEEFIEIVTNYPSILHKVNLIYFRIKSDAEDNFQEIIYQLWDLFQNLQNMNSISSWIYAVSITTSLSKKKDH
jgi:RNA polymerase sigma-70 factor, ECF subfamily